MKLLLVYLFFGTIFADIDLGKIAKRNKAKKEAESAFAQGHYNRAIQQYKLLLDSLGGNEDAARLNLAHAYLKNREDSVAKQEYEKLTNSQDNGIRSVAYQQLGNLYAKDKKLEEAIASLKNALKASPSNEEARHNYEVLKKKLQQQQQKDEPEKDKDKKEQDKQQQDKKEQDKKEQQEKEKQKQEQQEKEKQKQEKEQNADKKDQKDKKEGEQNQEGKDKGKEEEKEREKMMKEQLEKSNLDPEKAKMILDAMKSSEIQYLQQNQKKSNKKADRSKPDW